MKITFFGASHVAGVGLEDSSLRFGARIASALQASESNLGLAGSLVVGRDDTGMLISDDSAIARVPDVIDAAPDRVLVLYGDDDWRSSSLLGDEKAFRQGTFLWDYDTMVRGLLDALEQSQVVLSTVPSKDYGMKNVGGGTIGELNDHIRRTASRYDLTLIDWEQANGFGEGDFDADGRLTAGAHGKLADRIIPILGV